MRVKYLLTAEYPTVLKLSEDRAALEDAHSEPITPAQAEQLIYFYLDPDECKEVRFTGTARRAFAKYNGDFIRFDPRYLSKGIVLHEVAHIIAYKDNDGHTGHGAIFTAVLDNLIRGEK